MAGQIRFQEKYGLNFDDLQHKFNALYEAGKEGPFHHQLDHFSKKLYISN